MFDIGQTGYIPGYIPPAGEKRAWALAFLGEKILMKKAGNFFCFPEKAELDDIIGEFETCGYIGSYDGISCYGLATEEISEMPPGLNAVDLMQITGLTGDPGLFILAGTANHILHWSRMNRFCGKCGHETEDKADERAKICPACGNVIYPRISPATITAVFRGDEILLAHNRNFRGDVHSLIAGFIEPGETLEQCVAREVREEVGIEIKNIRYWGSQPWPFPDSLMIAFTAEYESGEISVDNTEISKARWFSADSLPAIPSSDSIAGKIIRWYASKR